MNWESLVAAFFMSTVIATLIGAFFNRNESKANTLEKLSNTVDTLRENLDEEIANNKKARKEFNELFKKQKKDCQEKINNLAKRVEELEKERDKLIIENHELKKELGKQ